MKKHEAILENDYFRIHVDKGNGSLASLFVKSNNCELIGEHRLKSNFRICLPLENYKGNYIEGEEQKPLSVNQSENSIDVVVSGMFSEQGSFPIDLSYSIVVEDEKITFTSRLTNNSDNPVSEFWFPRIGGWTQFGKGRNAKLATPNYRDCRHSIELFRNYPGTRDLGAEAAEWSTDYVGQSIWNIGTSMPWWDIYDEDSEMGLYLGYHDTTYRCSTWHTYLYPTQSGLPDAWLSDEAAGGEPVGLIFSHVRYPFIHSGETFESGEFILRVHKDDWHTGAKFYRAWFLKHFPIDNSTSWLRKKSAWFSSSILQPEDREVNDFEGFETLCKESGQYNIDTFEMIGWHKGGWERDYPEYYVSEDYGGRPAMRKLVRSLQETNGRLLAFVNYNVLDQNTELYRKELWTHTHQDEFGKTPNWMCWGQSHLLARQRLNVRRHVLASLTPRIHDILTDCFTKLAEDGVSGVQIDKICVGSVLDFNPLNTEKPDTALFEGMIQSIKTMREACRKINPEFCLASEAGQDRLLPYIDVFYRNAHNFTISPLRYVFPEWTSCIHISAPRDFNAVNSAVMTGAVICIEPDVFQGSLHQPKYQELAVYIHEIERIRAELNDIIFLGLYHDELNGKITEVEKRNDQDPDVPAKSGSETGEMPVMTGSAGNINSGFLHYKVHEHKKTGQKALIVANESTETAEYFWQFDAAKTDRAILYVPFEEHVEIDRDEVMRIPGYGLHIILESL